MEKRALIGITGRSELPRPPLSSPLHGVSEAYVRAVREVGGLPLVVPPVLEEEAAGPLLACLDGLLLSGGGDVAAEFYAGADSPLLMLVDRDRDRAELALAREALRTGRPILAICRGVQVLNVALGGTLYQDIGTQVPGALQHRSPDGQAKNVSTHPVRLVPGSRLADFLGTTEARVNSFHHQAARDVGEGLAVTARAPDGVIEGLEHQTHPFCVGVQWHPENPAGNREAMGCLFQAFVAAAAAR